MYENNEELKNNAIPTVTFL